MDYLSTNTVCLLIIQFINGPIFDSYLTSYATLVTSDVCRVTAGLDNSNKNLWGPHQDFPLVGVPLNMWLRFVRTHIYACIALVYDLVPLQNHGPPKLWDVSGVYLSGPLICSHCYVNTKSQIAQLEQEFNLISQTPLQKSTDREVDTLSLTTLIVKYMMHPNSLMKLRSCLFNRSNLLFPQIGNMLRI